MTMLLVIVFFAALAVLFYTYAGYPLLLLLWSKLGTTKVPQKNEFTPAVTIVVVVYNGAALIQKKIETCLAQNYPADKLRVLFVSDGSDDATCSMIESLNNPRVRLLALPNRRGKAACLNDAVKHVQDEFIVFNDVRQELHPAAVRELIANFADADVGAVSGELVFRQDQITGFGQGMDAYWRYEKFLRATESRVASSVGVTGAIYALRRVLFREIPDDTILDDVLIPMNVVMQKKRVLFERNAIAYDIPSRDAAQERVRKVRTLAGNFQLLFRRIDFLLPWRNPIALQFLSHKILRLIAPLALAAALFTNIALVYLQQSWWFVIMLALQLTSYAAALLGKYVPAANRLLPVKLASAFVSLNWFVVLGFVEFVFNRNAHLWKASTRPADASVTHSSSR